MILDKDFVLGRLAKYERWPGLHAFTVEGFVAQLAVYLDLIGISGSLFYERCFGPQPLPLATLSQPLTDEIGRAYLKIARELVLSARTQG